MSNKELNGLLIRLAITFIQGFFAVWSAAGFKADKVVLGGAVAAGISVGYNLVIKPWLESFNKIKGA